MKADHDSEKTEAAGVRGTGVGEGIQFVGRTGRAFAVTVCAGAALTRTALLLQSGNQGHWQLAVTVDGVQHLLTGKRITVDGWNYVRTEPDGAFAAGELVQGMP